MRWTIKTSLISSIVALLLVDVSFADDGAIECVAQLAPSDGDDVVAMTCGEVSGFFIPSHLFRREGGMAESFVVRPHLEEQLLAHKALVRELATATTALDRSRKFLVLELKNVEARLADCEADLPTWQDRLASCQDRLASCQDGSVWKNLLSGAIGAGACVAISYSLPHNCP